MKKVLNLFFICMLFITYSCGGIKEKTDSFADEMVEAILNGYSYQISQVERDLKSWVDDLSEKDAEEVSDYWEEALGKSFINAFKEDFSEIAENVKNRSKWGVKSAYKGFERKVDRIDKDYQEYAENSLSLFLGDYFSSDFKAYAKTVFDAVKADNKYYIGNADKEFTKNCDRLKEDCPAVVWALKKAYGKVLEKEFKQYLDERGKEVEKILKSGDREKAQKWFEDQKKQFENLLSKASDEIKSAFSAAYSAMTNEMQKQIE